ncbi:MAG TPA: IPT/TIG domain-containing protein [Vicinamibacteria bacterium]|nr:IPT/TIG domain-containing protein [Vicinamibacteria bacterium]
MSEPSQEPTHPVLIVTGPPRDGDMLALESLGFEHTLGSSPDCHLRLQAGNVDFSHARVVWEGRGVLMSDLGSAAGTYVNGEKIAADHVLHDGDRICLGPPGSKQSVKLLARIPAESAMPAPLVLAPEKDPFGLGEEPPAFDLMAPGTTTEPAAAAPPPVAAPPPPVIPPLPVPPSAPTAARGVSPVTTPAVIFDTPLPTPTPGSPAKPRRPGPDVTELPSIEAPPPAEPGPAAPEHRAPPRAPVRLPSVPPIVWIGVVAAGLFAAGVMAWMKMRPPTPALLALAPPHAEPGQVVVLTGTGFAPEPAGNTVRVGTRTTEVTAAAATQVTVRVPADLDRGGSPDLPVTVETSGGVSNPVFLRVRRLPRGLKLETDVALPGAEVTLAGENLDVKPLMVRVAGIPADLTDTQAGTVRFRVPGAVPFEEGRSVPVVVTVGADSAPALQLLLGRLPLIAELSPRTGRAGDRVTVRGRGFDPQPSGNVLTFGAEPALVLTATETEIVSIVPHVEAGAGQLDVPVGVKARGSASAGGRPFTMRRPSSAVFVPHFFAAPVTADPSGDRVFVSTALGPVLLLSGREDAPSPAERAARTAAALNAAFAAKTALDLRESPSPAVVARNGGVIVTATAADAAAYAPPLAPAGSGRASPRAVAAHWAALLQDMQALFVDRQRPVRVVQSSARGRVLLELYADGERLGGPGAGVPTRLVEPLPSAVARAFREMTLSVPTQAQATATAAVTGTWRGVMEEDGVGQRPMQLTLVAEGARLAGAMTSRSGKLGMDIPVHDVAYDKGVLTFRTTSGAAARRYRATLQGATLAGTIHAADVRDGAIGRFTLRYTE